MSKNQMKKRKKTQNGWRAHPIGNELFSNVALELRQIELLTRKIAERKLTKAQLQTLN
jgi:hypothetical protein